SWNFPMARRRPGAISQAATPPGVSSPAEDVAPPGYVAGMDQPDLPTQPNSPDQGAAAAPAGAIRAGAISVQGDRVRVEDLEFDDPVVAEILSRQEGPDRVRALVQMLGVGARGMTSMGLGLELSDVDRRVRATVADALEEGR